MEKRIVITALFTTLIAGTACAQSTPADQPRAKPPVARHGDTDGDGSVSRAEFLADAARRFEMMDADKDGQLTVDERRAARERLRAARGPGRPGFAPGEAPPGGALAATLPPPGSPALGADAAPGSARGRRGGMLARLDDNGDGQLTRAEFEAPFDRLDANRDGTIDQAEMAARRSFGAGPASADGRTGGGGRLARLDADGDGKISRSEFDRPFDRLDTDRSGVIDAGELAAVQGRFGGRRFGGNGPLRSESQLEPQ